MKDAGEEGDDEDTFFHEGAIGLILETKVLTPDRYQMQSDPRPLRALSETRVCRRDPLYNLAHLLYPDRTSTNREVGLQSGRATSNRTDSRHTDYKSLFVLPRLAVRDWRAPRKPCALDPFCRFKATIRSER